MDNPEDSKSEDGKRVEVETSESDSLKNALKEAQKKRASAQGWLKREINRTSDQFKAEVENDPEGLSQAIRKLKDRYDSFETALNKTHELMETEDIEGDVLNCEIIGCAESEIFRLECILRDQMAPSPKSGQQKEDQVNETSGSSSPTARSGSSGSTSKKNIRLPKLELRLFEGDVNQWIGWWDDFEGVIHKNTKLLGNEKFRYLRSLLRKDAAKVLEGLEGTEANYSIAIDLLKAKYDRKEMLIDQLVNRLRSLKLCRDVADVDALVVEVTICMRQLTILGEDPRKHGTILKSIVKEKLDQSWLLEWSRTVKGKDKADFSEFLDFLKTELEVRKAVLGVTSSSTPVAGHESKKTQNPRSAACLMCVFCDSSQHTAQQCSVPLSPSVRREKVKEKRACFRCAKVGHSYKKCFLRKRCDVCNRFHIPQLCLGADSQMQQSQTGGSEQNGTRPSQSSAQFYGNQVNHNREHGFRAQRGRARGSGVQQSYSQQRGGEVVAEEGSVNQVSESELSHVRATTTAVPQDGTMRGILLRTLRVRVNGIQEIRVLCDTGCSYSLVDRDVSVRSGARSVGRRFLTISGFGGGKAVGHFRVVEVRLQGSSGFGDIMVQAVEVPHLGSHIAGPSEAALIECTQAAGDVFADFGSVPLGMILGEDYYDAVITGPTCNLQSGLKATVSIFGLVVHGRWDIPSGVALSYRVSLEDFWDLEHLGVQDVENDLDTISRFEDQVQRQEDGRYETGFLWKPGARDMLPSNEGLARKRLQSMVRRLSLEEKSEYDKSLTKLEESGFIERAPQVPGGPVSYLPHRAIWKESSTTSHRIIYDASAKVKGGLSLNDCLSSGPSLLPQLLGVLLRFRTGRIAYIGDLEKAFLQISLKSEDRDSCRFLWFDQNEREVVFRWSRVGFGVTCSPFLLQAVLKTHLERDMRSSVKDLKGSIYVDDLIGSQNDDVSAVRVWTEAKEIFGEAKFKLRKLRTNSGLLKNLFEEDCAEETERKVLGIVWEQEDDVLRPGDGLHDLLGAVVRTKRELASLLARVYDPCGLIAPTVSEMKKILQDLWKEKRSWDAILSQTEIDRIQRAVSGLLEAREIRIPRWWQWEPEDKVTLHVFADSSERIYAVAVYLRIQKIDGSVKTALVGAKSRLAPAAGETIPRLELLGSVLGARFGQTVAAELSIEMKDVIFWTDSSAVYFWTISKVTSLPGVFVRNRVLELKERGTRWRWVPGAQNPSDIPTRGLTGSQLAQSVLWWSGPAFLKESEEKWPSVPSSVEEALCLVTTGESVSEPTVKHFLEDLVNSPRTNSWMKTVYSVVWMRRWCRPVGSEEFEVTTAEQIIFKNVQQAFFRNEIDSLEERRELPKQSSLKSFRPFLDEQGLLRMGGRLGLESVLPWEERHPVILLNCGATRNLIQHVHESNGHVGTGIVLVRLRKQGVWILRSKKTISSVIRKCRKCSRFLAKPGKEVTAPLPRCRTKFIRAFAVSGIDVGGPIFLEGGVKIWFALITCMSTRGIHIELLSGLSSEVMAMAVVRFIACHGDVQEMWSDHGTNFVGLAKLLKLRNLPVKWKFIVQRAPWWGGAWEREIGVLKGALRKSIGQGVIRTWEELETLMRTLEKAINERPISYSWESSDGVSVPVAIYPELFMRPTFPSDFDLCEMIPHLKNWAKTVEEVWKRDYFYQVLGESKSVISEENEGSRIHVGEVVLIGEPDQKRVAWRLGVVERMILGRDGRSRAAVVRVVDSRDQKLKRLQRPVQKLFRLEVREEAGQVEDDEEAGQVEDDEVVGQADKDKRSNESVSDPVRAPVDGSGRLEVLRDRRGRQIRLPARYRV